MQSYRRYIASANTQSNALERAAFTIIELLIVVTILLLLTTFTVVAIDFTFEAERVAAGARQVQSILEGARDRAIRARAPRGVRFLVDQDRDNGRMVTSMVYVGAAEPWNNGHITLKRPDVNGDRRADSDVVTIVEGSTETLWNNLRIRGYLGVYEVDSDGSGGLPDPNEDLNENGVWDRDTPRIKIPGDKNGTWYHVKTHLLGRDAIFPNRLELVHPYRDSGTTPADDVVAFEGTGPSTYILELPPRILPDAKPVLLPGGVVIDMDASQVPVAWRPPSTAAIPPDPNDPYKRYRVPYSNRMDLMFSPRGTVTGSSAGTGLIHFYIGLRTSVQFVTDAGRPVVDATASALVPMDGLINGMPEKPVLGDRALVSIFTSTGKVASHPLDPTDQFNNFTGAAGADNYADSPFTYAELGEVTSR